ncbi:hypothetical protein SADUNF_Sadunf16G0034700 [Salix dunnii]|uniref:Uncharacterized protein n=1 Tax=Salix dunnii TaxID=1413687 RepID=A0A835MI59_9ROSI|nr:hypothetical protein SADUNF_Sadunf16G0034700 [Salix dunnii]
MTEMQPSYQNRSSPDLHPQSEVQNAPPPKKVASWKPWDVKPNTLLDSHQFQSPGDGMTSIEPTAGTINDICVFSNRWHDKH